MQSKVRRNTLGVKCLRGELSLELNVLGWNFFGVNVLGWKSWSVLVLCVCGKGTETETISLFELSDMPHTTVDENVTHLIIGKTALEKLSVGTCIPFRVKHGVIENEKTFWRIKLDAAEDLKECSDCLSEFSDRFLDLFFWKFWSTK